MKNLEKSFNELVENNVVFDLNFSGQVLVDNYSQHKIPFGNCRQVMATDSGKLIAVRIAMNDCNNDVKVGYLFSDEEGKDLQLDDVVKFISSAVTGMFMDEIYGEEA